MPSAILITGDSAITTPLDMIFYHVVTRRNLRRSDYARSVYGSRRSVFNKKQKKSLQQLDDFFQSVNWDSIYWIPGNTETREMVEFMKEELPRWTCVQERTIIIESLNVVVSGHGYSLEHRGSDDIEYTMSDGEYYPMHFEPRVLSWMKKISPSFRKLQEDGEGLSMLAFHEFPSFKMQSSDGKEYRGGSKAILTAIETLQPDVALFGHFHELPVLNRFGRSILMNPGPAMEYCFGLIALEERKNETFRIKRVEKVRLHPDGLDPILFIYSKRPQLDPLGVKWQ